MLIAPKNCMISDYNNNIIIWSLGNSNTNIKVDVILVVNSVQFARYTFYFLGL